MQVRFDLNATIQWQTHRTKAGALVAECDPLGLSLQAQDEVELFSLIQEAQHLLFVDLLEEGELLGFLQKHGWKLNQPIPSDVRDPVRHEGESRSAEPMSRTPSRDAK